MTIYLVQREECCLKTSPKFWNTIHVTASEERAYQYAKDLGGKNKPPVRVIEEEEQDE